MDNSKLISPIEIALEMEKKGMEFYKESAEKVSNILIKQLLESLAREEMIHYDSFKEIYESIKKTNNWPGDISIEVDQNTKTVFEEYVKKNREKVEAASEELDIIRMAQEMEKKSYNFYNNLSKDVKHNNVRLFVEKLAEIESQHFDLLDNTYQYLNNPVDWYTEEEKPFFEG